MILSFRVVFLFFQNKPITRNKASATNNIKIEVKNDAQFNITGDFTMDYAGTNDEIEVKVKKHKLLPTNNN